MRVIDNEPPAAQHSVQWPPKFSPKNGYRRKPELGLRAVGEYHQHGVCTLAVRTTDWPLFLADTPSPHRRRPRRHFTPPGPPWRRWNAGQKIRPGKRQNQNHSLVWSCGAQVLFVISNAYYEFVKLDIKKPLRMLCNNLEWQLDLDSNFVYVCTFRSKQRWLWSVIVIANLLPRRLLLNKFWCENLLTVNFSRPLGNFGSRSECLLFERGKRPEKWRTCCEP